MTDLLVPPELPFSLKPGESREIALLNRMNAINRINWLVQRQYLDFNIRNKSDIWRQCWELEMYKRFYKDDPKHIIDEEFCQNGATVAGEMETKLTIMDEKEYEAAKMTAMNPSVKNSENKSFMGRVKDGLSFLVKTCI